MRGTTAAPKVKCREAEGPPVLERHTSMMLCATGLWHAPQEGQTPAKKSQAPYLPVLNKAVKITHPHEFH